MNKILTCLLFTCCIMGADKGKDVFHKTLFTDAPALFDASGKEVLPKYILKQKYLILYFSASWCGPCHKFNPEFIKWYQNNGGKKNVEVILVGSDADTASIKKYMKVEQFPWLAFEMKGKKFDEIKSKYGGKGIPCVALLDENDEVIAHSYVDGKYVGPMVPLNKYLELTKRWNLVR